MSNKNTWKAIAIVFITLFLLETSLIIFGIYLTSQQDKNEQICIMNICGYNFQTEKWEEDYFSYNYNTQSKVCSCFNEKGEIAKQKYLGK